MLKPGRNCWRVAQAGRAAVIVDAAEYFRLARETMLQARSQILLIGWDVDTRIALVPEAEAGDAPNCLGALLSWLSRERPDLGIYILVWDEGMIKIPGRGTTVLRMLNWWFDDRITVKFDSSHPLAASHHQKILVIDDAVAFCGGIDITADRWDTRDHRDDHPGRRRPFTGRRYQPWHDTTMIVDAAAAKALGDLGRERWKIATGDELPAPPAGRDLWPERLPADFVDPTIAIARTRGREGAISEVREIEALFVDLIAAAERFVYIETQYFASRRIAAAIAARLEEANGPEFLIVNPKTAEGWLDEEVMSPARHELVMALRDKDRHGRFRIYTPVTERGADIYVHAKVMIVDDVFLRIGSANLNNRSMGLDSECDLLIDGRDRPDIRQAIARLRSDLLAEHLGVEAREIADACEREQSLFEVVERSRSGGRSLSPFAPAEPNPVEQAVATSEALDPEAPDELFEPRARPGLLGGWRRGSRGRRGGPAGPAAAVAVLVAIVAAAGAAALGQRAFRRAR